MGKRREPRKEIKVPVRIFGTDKDGQIFSEKVSTSNVSQHGVLLAGVRAQPDIDEIVGVTYREVKSHFRVRWVGQPSTPQVGQLGLLNLTPDKTFWDFPLPPPGLDDAVRDARDRRTSFRVKCATSVEIYPIGEAAPIRTRTADLSLGGCFLEMPNPLPKAAQVRIALWIKETKIWANGEIVTSTPGFGVGMRFTEITESDKAQLREFIESTIRIRR